MSIFPTPFLQICPPNAQRLVSYIQIYRSFAWSHQAPSQERNAVLRFTQMLQGKLMAFLLEQQETLLLRFSPEDKSAMLLMIDDLISLYSQREQEEGRHHILGDLALLKKSIKQLR